MIMEAVVLDLDGTLLGSDKRVTERCARAVLDCRERGLSIIFATARPPRTVEWLLPGELKAAGSFVYYNGAQISCRLSGLDFHEAVPSALAGEIIDYCLLSEPDADIGIEVKDEWYALRDIDPALLANVRVGPAVRPLETLKSFDATKILLTRFADAAGLIERYRSQVNILVTDAGRLIQISSLAASKEAAVSLLCDRLGISLDRVIAFGDDYNDVGLFRVCGWPVAMGNAVDELKKLSRETTASNDEDGVAQTLERLLSGSPGSGAKAF